MTKQNQGFIQHQFSKKQKTSAGFTLIEGLIALVIAAVVVVGFVYALARISGSAQKGIENTPQQTLPINNGGGTPPPPSGGGPNIY